MSPYPLTALTESNVGDLEAIHEHGALDTIPEDASQRGEPAPVSSLKAGWLGRNNDTRSVAAESVASTTRGMIDEEQEQVRLDKVRVSGTGALLQGSVDEASETQPPVKSCCSKLNWKTWSLLAFIALAMLGVAIYFVVSNTVDNSDPSQANTDQDQIVTPVSDDDFLPTSPPSISPEPTISPSKRPSSAPSLRPSSSPSVLEARTTLQPSMSPDAIELVTFLADMLSDQSAALLSINGTVQNRALEWTLYGDPEQVRIATHGEFRVKQRFVLALLYLQLEGGHWLPKRFMNEKHECDWDGIRCSQEDVVDGILLDNANLTGSLPQEIGLLSILRGLSFHNNSLTGTIPQSYYALSDLTWWDLGQNLLTGQLSSELWDMPSLSVFCVDENNLTGALPEMDNPSTSMINLDASFNQLTGSIPAGFWGLTNLNYLYLNDNLLEGTVPPFADDASLQLRTLWLQDNALEGELPDPQGALNKLEKVVLYQNVFTSTVPTAWFELPSLSYMDFSENVLSGTIPDMENSPTLKYMFLNNNSFSGNLPQILPRSIMYVWLHYNSFTGEIPPNFGVGYNNLTELLLHCNDLSGSISTDLCGDQLEIQLEADCLNNESTTFVQCSCCRCY